MLLHLLFFFTPMVEVRACLRRRDVLGLACVIIVSAFAACGDNTNPRQISRNDSRDTHASQRHAPPLASNAAKRRLANGMSLCVHDRSLGTLRHSDVVL